MKILFLHGWKSVPGGVKPTYLKGCGHTVINPPLDDDDFDAALEVAQREFDLYQPDVVVGSSRGGALAMNLRSGSAGLVLLCPAWRKFGAAKTTKKATAILHSRADDVIPFADSEELVRASGMEGEALVEVGSDHRLADAESLKAMNWLCEYYGKHRSFPWLIDGKSDQEKLPRRAKESAESTASYVCDSCGETIVIPVDLSEGHEQSYVEDCPVCCNPNVLHVSVNEEGLAEVRAEPEQDPI